LNLLATAGGMQVGVLVRRQGLDYPTAMGSFSDPVGSAKDDVTIAA
jgi:hypothetical protein